MFTKFLSSFTASVIMSQRRGRPWDRNRSQGWGQGQSSRHNSRPAGLKGKDIGLYYRDRARANKQSKKETVRERVVDLRIPLAIQSKVVSNLRNIQKVADQLNIRIAQPKLTSNDVSKTNIKKKNDAKYTNDESSSFFNMPGDNNDFKIPQEPISQMMNDSVNAGTSSEDFIPLRSAKFDDYKPKERCLSNDESSSFLNMSVESDNFKIPQDPISGKMNDSVTAGNSSEDFIPLRSAEFVDYKPKERILSLRGGGDFKYSYQDIITGTFDEKLDECLSKGIAISQTSNEIIELNRTLYEKHNEMLSRSGYKKMLKFRETLPTYKKSKELLDVINNNQVVVISGETGCGKSTQVPQLILDQAITNSSGANVKILVTQPRRIAASSLAARVAEERGEKMGQSVGYAVRLEKIDPRPRGSIVFCTTGILLADLEVNQGLTNYSHIILDEVHERDSHIDLSMCMLRKVLQKRKDLKLILMSATIDAESLSSYFNNCPMMHIEGLAYPVTDIYLEDIVQTIQYEIPPEFKSKNFNRKPQPKWMKYKKNSGPSQQDRILESDVQYKAEIAPWLESIKHKLDRHTYTTLQDSRIEELNIDLMLQLLVNICRGPPGAILIFLPGIGEITKLIRMMEDSQMFPSHSFNIYPLHSKLPSLEQHKIFETPPNGIRKVIIATNIAETSITIDDIVYVIDCGKIKMSGLNVDENVSTLKIEWVSQANLRQRRGRAGRCQPGICYHLVTSYRASKLEDRLLPELQRSNLLEPVLTIKRLRLGKAEDAMKDVPAPPAEATVKWAVKHLQQCGGLDDEETLTPLGWHLARLPVHPSAGKLLLFGALFGCLDRAASVAAVWGFKDPFQLVIGKEDLVDQIRRDFAQGEPSDQVAISEAIIQWERLPYQRRRSFTYENFLSNNTLELLSDMKKQLVDSLRQMGFLAVADVKSPWENRNSNNLSLFKALVAAALYPNIATVRWINKNGIGKFKQTRVKVYTPEDARNISIHPSSVMSVPSNPKKGPVKLCDSPGANWLVYWLKQKSSDLFLLEVTLVYTLPLLFFGELKVQVNPSQSEDECFMLLSTVKVRCKKNTANILFELRSMLDQVLASKVMVSSDHGTRHSEFEESVLNTVIQLITAEDEQVDYLDDDLSESDHSEYGSRYK